MRLKVEWWPERGSGPLWVEGASVEPATLLPTELVDRVGAWNDAFVDDDLLPVESEGDVEWLSEGRELLAAVRAALSETHDVIVTELWWNEPAEDEGPPTSRAT